MTNSTAKEIAFLDGIVSAKWIAYSTGERIRKALQGYIDHARTRRWDDGVDVEIVRKHAAKLLLDL